ncbi:MAG: hypothetical protein KDA47_19900 [Planctomycetales bacterium]|nr:hypothetical protein [Planctomycetales bacterium]
MVLGLAAARPVDAAFVPEAAERLRLLELEFDVVERLDVVREEPDRPTVEPAARFEPPLAPFLSEALALAFRAKLRTNCSLRMECQPAIPSFLAISAKSLRE